jgi:hypothetical protein
MSITILVVQTVGLLANLFTMSIGIKALKEQGRRKTSLLPHLKGSK